MSDTARLVVKRGSLYLDAAAHDRFFPGIDAVILIRRDDDLLVLPVVHAAAGGYLMKRRNSAGDRVAAAADFFREHGIEDDAEKSFEARWREDWAGLVAVGAFV